MELTLKLTWKRALWAAFAVSVVLAAVSVWWYAESPGVASYQASSLLTLPLFLFVAVWLHLHLPMPVQWIAAGALALVGPVGYLVFGGDQWWNWGQLTPVPLFLLLLSRAGPPTAEAESWATAPGGLHDRQTGAALGYPSGPARPSANAAPLHRSP